MPAYQLVTQHDKLDRRLSADMVRRMLSPLGIRQPTWNLNAVRSARFVIKACARLPGLFRREDTFISMTPNFKD